MRPSWAAEQPNRATQHFGAGSNKPQTGNQGVLRSTRWVGAAINSSVDNGRQGTHSRTRLQTATVSSYTKYGGLSKPTHEYNNAGHLPTQKQAPLSTKNLFSETTNYAHNGTSGEIDFYNPMATQGRRFTGTGGLGGVGRGRQGSGRGVLGPTQKVNISHENVRLSSGGEDKSSELFHARRKSSSKENKRVMPLKKMETMPSGLT